MKKEVHLCLTCQGCCRECFDGDTIVYHCDDYKNKEEICTTKTEGKQKKVM